MTAPKLVLVGPPGAGKTTVGRLVATALGVDFRDTDADIVAETGREIADIFVDDGEDVFRALEVAAVCAALEQHRGVLSLGGGAVLHPDTRARLAAPFVAFLDVTLEDAARRTGLSAARPLLAVNPRAQLRAMLAERRPLYLEVADAVISTLGRTPEQVAADVVATVQM